MSWMEGVGPVKDIDELGKSKGLHKHWYSNKKPKWKERRGEIEKGNFWDIIDNPLYQVAAEAKGYDWAEWVKDAKGKVGTGPNDGTARVRAVIKPGRRASTGTRRLREGQTSTYDIPGTAAEYEWMTRDEADERGLDYEVGKTTRWKNKETGEIITGHPNAGKSEGYGGMGNATLYGMQLGDLAGGTLGAVGARMFGSKKDKDWEDNWEELRDWGSHDAGVNEDLDEINKWLVDIVNVNDHLPKIIREGPKGEHYGIEGDIWEHYGLDEEIEPPEEMEWDSYDKKMNLKTAVTSNVTYSTPEGITPVDLHSDD